MREVVERLRTAAALTATLMMSTALGATIDPVTDWSTRSANTIHAQNFGSYTTDAQLRAAAFGVTNPTHVTLSTEHGLSGKACRIAVLKGDGSDHGSWIDYLNGADGTLYKKFYFQLVIWQDQWLNWPYQSSDGLSTPKILILDRQDGSSNTGEIVLTNAHMRGFVTAYRLTTGGSFAQFERTRSTPANSNNFQWQPEVNRTSPANPTTQNQFEQKYGPFYAGMTGTTSPGIPLDQQGIPDPDAAVGGITWARGNWTVVEIFVDYDNDRVDIWAAPYGSDPIQIVDSSNTSEGSAEINPRDIAGYRGFHLLPYRTRGVGESNRPDTYLDYVEVIVSANPIPFPGNKALDGSGGNPLVPRPPTGLNVN